ncbi:MAG: ISL3 family transposase [Bacteroidales bacterium]
MDPKKLEYQYKEYISNYRQWQGATTALDYVIYKKNLGKHLSLDETCLSQGELYTILTNKSAHGKKGSLVAMVRGTKSETVIRTLMLMPRSLRLKVREITLDLSPTMKLIARRCFPNAILVSDRFHVQRLVSEAISDLRISHRWQAIDLENAEIALARETGRRFVPHTFENGDTRRQLLARSRTVVMKHSGRWTESQRKRAEILFREYPDIKAAYQASMALTDIYNEKILSKGVALAKLAHWYDRVEKLSCKYFKSVIESMQNNYATIVNYFDNRSTNASAESFNAKIKAFRSQFRGVRDIPFFIYRLEKLYA